MVQLYKSKGVNKKEEQKDNAVSLVSFLYGVSGVINQYCSSFRWVTCELVRFNQSGGNYYLEITDVDENGKKLKSQTAVIFKSKVFKILSKFNEHTGMNLSSGMKLMVNMKANFKPEYGFSLIIDDINPSFTIGDLEIKYNKIRDFLNKKGFDKLNKQKALPSYYGRVAVLSPANAAGLGDFKSEAVRMEKYGICQFDYYAAKFEGEGVEESITEKLKEIYENGIDKYDALVFIRGGGSTGSLQSLNEVKILAYLCKFPIPVISGIGHERDKVLIDEYVRLSLDTPSKVAEYIFSVNQGVYFEAERNYTLISRMVSSIINDNIILLNSSYDFVKSLFNNYIDGKIYNMGYTYQSIKSTVDMVISDNQNKLENLYERIILDAENNILQKQKDVNLLNNDVLVKSLMVVEGFISKKDHVYEVIEMNSYKENLKKGYAIIRSLDGNIVTSSKVNLKYGFNIQFADGIKEIKFEENK